MKPVPLFDSGLGRVFRGGCWVESLPYVSLTAHSRLMASYRYSDLGFRLFLGAR